MFTKALSILAASALVLTAGCGGGSNPDQTSNARDPEQRKPETGGSGGTAVVKPPSGGGGEAYDDAKATGAVKGVVTLEGKAPTMLTIPVPDKACEAHRVKDNMSPLKREDIVVSADGKLANVVVFVSKGAEKYNFDNYPIKPARINQYGCQYTPHVLALKTYQPLEIQSSDPVAHNIHCDALTSFNLSQPNEGIHDVKPKFTSPEMDVQIKCDVHNWMYARACVFDHIFFDVTKADGTFEIKLPPGDYELDTWQETQTPMDKPKKWKVKPSGGSLISN